MNGIGKRFKSIKQGRSWRVEEFVTDAEYAGGLNRAASLPITLSHQFFKRHSITSAAPGGDHYIGIQSRYLVRRNFFSGRAHKFTARGINQLRNPALGCNERLAPFLAKDTRAG